MIWRLLPLAGFLALAALLYAGIQLNKERPPDRLPSVLIDKPAPAFQLDGLRDGEERIDSARFLGQPWLLNVWASWCAGCRIEHPQMEQLAQRPDVVLVGLNWKDERTDALRWLNQFGDPYHYIAADPDNRVGLHFGVYGAPETFVIDAQGVIRHKFVGPVSQHDVDTVLLPLLARLHAQAPASPQASASASASHSGFDPALAATDRPAAPEATP
ncbi:MAG: DsbE family thiol:disulfide interchange protein [Xanthomonadales bacterium]|nr:DsbE family thiol:disulfide interchange protein [Xanthomonadales bacterium]